MNPLYLRIDPARGYIEEENENKYIVFDYADKNKCIDVFNEIMDKINERYNNDYDYEKDYMEIRFSFDDNLPLNESLNFHNMTITIRYIFEEDGKLYPEVFLDDTLYELNP